MDSRDPRRPVRDYDRPSRDYDYDRRGLTDRAGDEVRSWFGDDEARRRRALDERYDDAYDNELDDRLERRFDALERRVEGFLARFGGHADLDDDDFDRDYNRDYARRKARRGPVGDQGRRSGSALRDDIRMDRRDRYGRDNRVYERDTRFGFDFGLRDQDRDVMRDRDYDLPTNLGYGRRARGPHAGTGPEGYTRSAERIVEDVSERLTENGFLDASRIRVSAEDGEVTLEGTVPSRSEKRLADDLAEQVRGVRDVHNRLTLAQAAETRDRQPDTGETATANGAMADTA